MDKRKKIQYIKRGVKDSFLYSLIAAAALLVIAAIVALIKHISLLQCIFMAFYYGGGFLMIFAVPLLLKRNEDPKLRKVKRLSPLYGFYDMFDNPYLDKEMEESYEEFKSDGFYLGMFIVLTSVLLFLYAGVLEKLYYLIGGVK